MGKSEIPCVVTEKERLDILDTASTCGRISHVAYRHRTRKRSHLLLVEHFGHKALTLDPPQLSGIVHGHYAAAFLSPVLQGMESVIDKACSLRHSPDAEDTAFFMQPLRL